MKCVQCWPAAYWNVIQWIAKWNVFRISRLIIKTVLVRWMILICQSEAISNSQNMKPLITNSHEFIVIFRIWNFYLSRMLSLLLQNIWNFSNSYHLEDYKLYFSGTAHMVVRVIVILARSQQLNPQAHQQQKIPMISQSSILMRWLL